jgi:hypothetical protein
MRVSYSNVMATIAVFIALGGTGVAAVSLSRNSVGSEQIRRGAVRTSDLHRSAVRSSKVKNGSLLAKDFALGQLPSGPKGDTGARGATGPAGPTYGGVFGDTPPASLEGAGSVLFTEINVPAAGDLLIFARNAPANESCTNKPPMTFCTIHLGIYLDGKPVPGSDVQYSGDNQPVPEPPPELFGVVRGVSPGPHSVYVWSTSPDGFTNTNGGPGNGAIGWVLLGG